MKTRNHGLVIRMTMLLACLLAMYAGQAQAAVTIKDDFTGASSLASWAVAVDPEGSTGAHSAPCLTAGSSGTTSATSIRYCSNLAAGSNPGGYSNNLSSTTHDTIGQGALRLTDPTGNETSAIISAVPFPSATGLQATFTSYSYDGSSTPADGFSFFLLDASQYTVNVTTTAQPTITYANSGYGTNIYQGNAGGSFGYACSNNKTPNIAGVIGGYLALGMDEYGNFDNSGDNSNLGVSPTSPYTITTTSYAANPAGKDRLGLRGQGNMTWAWLSTNYPDWYPSTLSSTVKGSQHSGNYTLQQDAVFDTCAAGQLQNWSKGGTTSTSLASTIPMTAFLKSTGASATSVSYTQLTAASITFSNSPAASLPSGDYAIWGGTSATALLTTANTLSGATYYPSTLTSSCQTAAVTAAKLSNSVVQNWSACTSSSYSAPSVASPFIPDYAPLATVAGGSTAAIYQFGTTTSPTTLSQTSTRSRSAATPIAWKLVLTPQGKLSVSYSYNGGAYVTAIPQQDITAGNGAMPTNFLFGFGGSTGGSYQVHEITCFQAVPTEQGATSATANGQQSGQYRTATTVYLAGYYTVNPQTTVAGWWGSLTANDLLTNSTTGAITISGTADWDAACNLTGSALMYSATCSSTGGTSVTAQTPASRTILTSSTAGVGKGVAFEWSGDAADKNTAATSYITSTQQTALGTSTVLDYLRGDRSNEGTGATNFRARFAVLGDIVDSSPTFVGPPSSPYTGTWTDFLLGSTGSSMIENTIATNYSAFETNYANRLNVVYAGSNDGMLHGFEAGNASGSYNDGLEVIAYVPAATITTINSSTTASIDFPNTSYSHNFYVDAPPGTGDLIYNNAWVTWLVSGLGVGGNSGTDTATISSSNTALYALDITNPGNGGSSVGNFSEASPTNVVIGEWSPSTLTCVNTTPNTCGTGNLGNIMGAPEIRRLHDGNWGAVFGNGMYSSSGTAGIFIMEASNNSSAITFRYLDSGSTGGSNGIAQITTADLDADGVIDYVYGGDLKGNMWRFDLISATPGNWAVHDFTGGSSTNHPLFTTATGQPITDAPVVAIVQSSIGQPRVIIGFGTGEQLAPQTSTSNATYTSSATQALYGIWDWDMYTWNHLGGFPMSYLSINATTTGTSSLQGQSIALDSLGNRTVTQLSVCWSGSAGCTGSAAKLGWYINLPGTGEQAIFNPVYAYGEFLINTTIPASATSCSPGNATGFTMAVSIGTGGGGSFFTGLTDSNVVNGLPLNATGSPQILKVGTQLVVASQGTGGTGSNLTSFTPPTTGGIGYRANWTQLR